MLLYLRDCLYGLRVDTIYFLLQYILPLGKLVQQPIHRRLKVLHVLVQRAIKAAIEVVWALYLVRNLAPHLVPKRLYMQQVPLCLKLQFHYPIQPGLRHFLDLTLGQICRLCLNHAPGLLDLEQAFLVVFGLHHVQDIYNKKTNQIKEYQN